MARNEEGFLGIGGRKGCCLLFLPALLVIIFSSFAVGQSLAAPDLGAPPRGPIDGYNQTQLIQKIATDVTSGLKTSPHVTEQLSEDDLGVIARALNPNPQQLSDLQVRLRDGLVVVSGLAHIGPTTFTAVARFEVGLNLTSGGQQQFEAQLKNFELGQFVVPGWMQKVLSAQGITPPDIAQLFNDPKFSEITDDVDCALITTQGLVIGFHQIGVQAMPQSCHS